MVQLQRKETIPTRLSRMAFIPGLEAMVEETDAGLFPEVS